MHKEQSSKFFLKWIVSLFLLLSGASALIYQVLWVRLLSLSIGSTSVSISIVLAVFFLGLGLGSYYAGALIDRFKNALKIYIVAETIIALSALVLLPTLLNLDYFISFVPIVETGIWLKFFIVTLLLFIPTFFIGTTFPLLMAVAIRHKSELRERLAHFYAFNSVGAVAGVLCSGVYLIPYFGLDGTMYIAVFINILIALIGILFYNRISTFDSANTLSLETKQDRVKPNNKALVVLFVTGLAAIATEVGWMKFLIIYTGSTIYGFSFILAMFLTGLSIGSFVAKLPIFSKINTQKTIFFGLILLALSLIGARMGLGVFPEFYEQLNSFDVSPFIYRWSKYLAMFLILLPPTVIFGALFPITLKYYTNDTNRAYDYVGRAYALNIAAGVIGSVIAGFWIIPHYSTDFLLTAIAIFVLLSSLVFIKSIKIKRAVLVWSGFGSFILFLSFYGVHVDYRKMIKIVIERNNKYVPQNAKLNIQYLKEGQTGIIGLHSYENTPCIVKLSNNGMNESWIDTCNPNNMVLSEFLLAQIALMLNPNANDAFVLGYGGATTVRAMGMSELRSIDVVELDEAVIEAVKTLYSGRLPTDSDSRVNIKINDARNSLLISNKVYDIIVSQPSHPWLMGASNIMNKDFFEIAKSRLSKGGVNGQWVPLFKIDIATLKGIIKAYTSTFEHVVSFVNVSTRDFLMFGSNEPIVISYEAVKKQMQNPMTRAVLHENGIKEPEDIMEFFALSREELVLISANAETATDKNLLTETFLSKYQEREDNSFDTLGFLRKHFSHDVKSYLRN
ncbi:MAG: fused MFS/spermidine synthase [Sulfurimonas sp.]|uniref:fused MFS/spermidine synthase n=1 Tax=Sulfurimonas sp. TaxID=2022749 RepID=UPI002631B6A0|nr:fused MFS/spermidine synthase [Sulfurimonas sp.]MCW8895589.1 fused MFS/spermidine synthase [Sulfurimonas sp.]MCW8954760.1 fused MFS/spermidine synthase [Sulfurimonas sp.]MCW9067604.1 fused MFS/spermidine synthase [Sulfurimonas sp.]